MRKSKLYANERLLKQIPLAIGPEAARTFENFLPGPNAAALAHLQRLAPGAPPVYLWGPPGSGKSHLLHAVVERAQQQGAATAWFEAATPAPWQVPEHCDWIALDDCQALDAGAAAGGLRPVRRRRRRRAR